jgi:glycosyltransferase involved in cell wall biosynthesis
LLEYYKNNTDRSKFSYYLPNGVNLENFNFELNNGIQIKNSLGIDSEIVIGFIGNVRPYHQTDILIDVAKKIVNEVKNFRIFMLTGDDKNKDLFLEKIHEQKLDKYFIFYKSVNNDEIPEIIKIMDICVLPGFSWYGSPMKIFEYAAMKKPIVGPDIPPLTDVFINGKSVLLTEKNNSVDIAEKIIYLFKNPESRKLLGENAYNTVKENNTWTRNIEKILVHYEDFISAKIN